MLIKQKDQMEVQNAGGVGGCRAHLSSQMQEEYNFRHRSACRTASEGRQELPDQQ